MEKADIESIPIQKTFDLKDEKDAYDAAEEMVKIGFYKEKNVRMERRRNSNLVFIASCNEYWSRICRIYITISFLCLDWVVGLPWKS